MPQYGEGADHRERVKHFVYDYAYTTKSGPIPKLTEPRKQLSPRYQSWYEAYSKRKLGPRNPVPSLVDRETDGQSGYVDSDTPLYFTASSPFVLSNSVASSSSVSNTRSFYSLPCYSSLEEDPRSQVKHPIHHTPDDPKLSNVLYDVPSRRSGTLTSHQEGGEQFSSLQHIKPEQARDSPQQSLPSYPDKSSDFASSSRNVPSISGRIGSLSPPPPPNSPTPSSLKLRPQRTLSLSHPYAPKPSNRVRSHSAAGRSKRRSLAAQDTDWALPASPADAYWQCASQEEVRHRSILPLVYQVWEHFLCR